MTSFSSLTRRTLLAAALAFTAAGAAWAETKPFETEAFEQAKASGKPVLVEITAPWCPICKAQKPIIAALQAEPQFKDFVVFEIDFDNRKDLVRSVGATHQSTLIVFKNGKEAGRSVGESQKEWIADLLEKAL